jgi:diaminohydroxyphosphoribosylaminopyrimidine deaminase / 5-amino-6-(5-phosphoribosylamino)uracil reductase
MKEALALAQKGLGTTSPNPMVGCVIVDAQGECVGRGFHKKAGLAHAECVALQEAGERARGADAYVTLEPCCHFGRTGPCADQLVKAGIKRVYVGMQDPNPKVNGCGIAYLRQHGIAVIEQVLEEECLQLNQAYVYKTKFGLPWVEVKFAQSLDGCIATKNGESQWISGELARREGRKLRHALDGIVVGIQSVLTDNPQLTCRFEGGEDPIRIVFDTHARLPLDAKVIDSSSAPCWVVVGESVQEEKCKALEKVGCKIIRVALENGHASVSSFLNKMREESILSLLIEGGPTLIGSFFDACAVQKVHAFIAPKIIGGKAKHAVGGSGVETLCKVHALRDTSFQILGEDFYLQGYVREKKK